jgi:hypothetical protein
LNEYSFITNKMKPFPYSATSIQAGRNKIRENIFADIGDR